MSKGIVVKLWNISAGSNSKRPASTQLDSSINYIMNEEKTSVSLPFQQLQNVNNYAINDLKTINGLYTGCRNISDIKSATSEMVDVKNFYHKNDGRIALHGMISLDSLESDVKNANKLMMLMDEVLEEIFPDNQCVFAVHTNTDNLHIHFIVNTVSLNGKKIHMDNNFIKDILQPCVNKKALQYGFTPNAQWVMNKSPNKMTFADRKIAIRNDIDVAIEKAESLNDVIFELKKKGYTCNLGKYLSLQNKNMSKSLRTYQLGKNYTVDSIAERIKERKEVFVMKEVGNYAQNINKKIMTFVPTKMKKYKDMTKDEQKKIIHQLKLGKNPWGEHYASSWQSQRIADKLNKTASVINSIKIYSENGNTNKALDNIIELKKIIAVEKREVNNNLKRHKPEIDIYKEIKKHEVRSYLYEYVGREEYKEDYDVVQELSNRLRDGYDKSIQDVSNFIENENNQILYANAQLKELSDTYKSIASYSKISKNNTLYDAIGHSNVIEQAKMNIYSTGVKYIVGKDKDTYIKIIIGPDNINGKLTENIKAQLCNNDGKIIAEVSTLKNGIKNFNQWIKDTSDEYKYDECHSFKNKESIKIYKKNQSQQKNQAL